MTTSVSFSDYKTKTSMFSNDYNTTFISSNDCNRATLCFSDYSAIIFIFSNNYNTVTFMSSNDYKGKHAIKS